MTSETSVDVLAVMREASAILIREGHKVIPEDLLNAHDHVAELIEQRAALTRALNAALPHVEHAYHTHADPDGSFWIDVVGCRAALSRIAGEA